MIVVVIVCLILVGIPLITALKERNAYKAKLAKGSFFENEKYVEVNAKRNPAALVLLIISAITGIIAFLFMFAPVVTVAGQSINGFDYCFDGAKYAAVPREDFSPMDSVFPILGGSIVFLFGLFAVLFLFTVAFINPYRTYLIPKNRDSVDYKDLGKVAKENHVRKEASPGSFVGGTVFFALMMLTIIILEAVSFINSGSFLKYDSLLYKLEFAAFFIPLFSGVSLITLVVGMSIGMNTYRIRVE